MKPASAQQVQFQAGDGYHLAAGSYRLRVLAGSMWLPEEHGFLLTKQASARLN